MATARVRQQLAIGSSQWIQSERDHKDQLVEQEVEEFGYAARNELEWLNEHMAEIFSKQQMNLTDVFKTPGKLRGKTPRTAKKRDPQRAPLTDLFAPNPQSVLSPAQRTPFYQKVSKISVAKEDHTEPKRQASPNRSPVRVGKENADSGYHGMTEDEMDVDASSRVPHVQRANADVPLLPRAPATNNLLAVEARTTEESFVSAKEAPDGESQSFEDKHTPAEEDLSGGYEALQSARQAMNAHVDGQRDEGNEISIHEDEPDRSEVTARPDSVSDTSSPDQPLVRKSSLNFASLPPRETLTGKRSIGARNSQMQSTQDRVSHAFKTNQDTDMESAEDAAIHNKTSTQRLHDRINMLGQTREPRPSKSIPAAYSVLPAVSPKEDETSGQDDNEDEDSWIAPIDRTSNHSNAASAMSLGGGVQTDTQEQKSPGKGIYGHQKSISTPNILSPTKHALANESVRPKASSVSVPNMGQASSTTPTSSPKKFTEGPLSASKARFYSVLKSAKGMFASSAGASAQAKVEASALSTAPSKESLSDQSAMPKMPGGFEDDVASLRTMVTASSLSSKFASAAQSPTREGRKTRSSSENEKKKGKQSKAEQKTMDELEKVREKERRKATQQKQERERAEQERLAQQERECAEAAAKEEEQKVAAEREQQAASGQVMGPPGRLRAPGRLVKPARQAPAQGARPVPVNIRLASQAQRFGSAQPSTSSNSLLEPTPPPTSRPASAAGRPGVTRAGSAQPGSARGVKALEAAARKKELEEKAAVKKAEQKRELERKRAAKLEEDRRVEHERKQEEQRKAQEARAIAQRQAEVRKMEQHRRDAAAAAAKAKQEAEMVEALEKERVRQAQQSYPRTDLPGTMRQLSKQTVDMPPKGSKRPLGKDAEETGRMSTLNRGGPSYQQQDAKRRRTEDEEDIEMHERHSVMAPPKRPSNMRKETLGTKFPHGYAHAPPPAAHHAQNIYKASVSSQPTHQPLKPGMHPNETIKLSTARIPFAENANPPAHHDGTHHPTTKTPTAPGTFKTPARPPAYMQHSKTKSSPAYANGDAIALPEINTDSEDESDSDTSPATKNATASFRAPSWVASPALKELLTQQQLVDPESVFGPIATLNMDEVFKGGDRKTQDRMRRYRERGESAMWVESGDQVTSAEKRRDREARERVVREGGWRFGGDL
ncbi:Inner centromere protein-related protein pic1 [Sphaceloma murrayae]|uniref:Inner centromere protein-related protein pic1 n=1 Tax=Sphaceloma murrayae TaxID=2082308 RepID=A0A2K1QJJ1_9PEZI|nr:Inner centromere protein-related protein pic1 [Sphaceloma murrayae]